MCVWGCTGHIVAGGALESVFRNDLQQEVVRAGVTGMKADWAIQGEGGDHDCKLEIERLQIDNQLQDAVHPVILCIAPSVPASSSDAPAVAVSLVATKDFLHIRRCRLHLQPLTLNADWMFASQAIHPELSYNHQTVSSPNRLSCSSFRFAPDSRPPMLLCLSTTAAVLAAA